MLVKQVIKSAPKSHPRILVVSQQVVYQLLALDDAGVSAQFLLLVLHELEVGQENIHVGILPRLEDIQIFRQRSHNFTILTKKTLVTLIKYREALFVDDHAHLVLLIGVF